MLFLDSRNELARAAISSILQRGEVGKGRNHGNRDSSSGVSDSPYQVSSASTLRDTESIREVMPVALIKLNMNLCSGVNKIKRKIKCKVDRTTKIILLPNISVRQH